MIQTPPPPSSFDLCELLLSYLFLVFDLLLWYEFSRSHQVLLCHPHKIHLKVYIIFNLNTFLNPSPTLQKHIFCLCPPPPPPSVRDPPPSPPPLRGGLSCHQSGLCGQGLQMRGCGPRGGRPKAKTTKIGQRAFSGALSKLRPRNVAILLSISTSFCISLVDLKMILD